MKLKEEFKQVDYHGIPLVIDARCNWIATDKDGETWAFALEPTIEPTTDNTVHSQIWSAGPSYADRCPDFDLDGMNWEESLVEIAA